MSIRRLTLVSCMVAMPLIISPGSLAQAVEPLFDRAAKAAVDKLGPRSFPPEAPGNAEIEFPFAHNVKAEASGGLTVTLKANLKVFNDDVQAARKACIAGNLKEYRDNWKMAVREVDLPDSNDPRLPYALSHCADAWLVENPDFALQLLRRSVEIRERQGSKMSPGMVRSLERLGMIELVHARPLVAQELLDRALELAEKLDVNKSLIGMTLQSAISAKYLIGDLDNAKKLNEQLALIAQDPSTGSLSLNFLRAVNCNRLLFAQADNIGAEVGEANENLKKLDSKSTSPESIQAIQKAYGLVETDIDQAEEKSFEQY